MNAHASSAKHTPGPWRFDDGVVDTAEGGMEICTVCCADDFPCITDTEDKTEAEVRAEVDAECDANGRLIAAAPDMLQALRWFIDDIDGTHTVMVDFDSNVARARAAIARATGASS